MQPAFLGIDNGGTATKAAVFNEKGELLSVARRSTPVTSPEPGWYERDMEQLWQLTGEVIREALQKAGEAEILAVACTGHGKGLYLWGNNGPVHAAIASTDARAETLVDVLLEQGIQNQLFPLTLQPLLACQPAALLRWLKQEKRDIYRQIEYVFEAKDYIRFRLTGEARAELTDFSGTSLLNLNTAAFDKRIFTILDIPEMERALPPVCQAGEVCGTVHAAAAALTGLKAGTPVCGGMFDIDACALAMGITGGEDIAVITGTWSINEYISRQPVLDSPGTKNSLYCLPGYYLIEESSPTSAGNLEWFISQWQLERQSVYQELDALLQSTAPTSALFLPFLYGTSLSHNTGACLAGLHEGLTRNDLLRAVLEGVVFGHQYHIERLLGRRAPPRALRLCGGAARSRGWVQLFADVSGLPVETVAGEELGALGCAITAAAAGFYKGYGEALTHMSRVAYTATPKASPLRDKYQAYKRLLAAQEGTPCWKP